MADTCRDNTNANKIATVAFISVNNGGHLAPMLRVAQEMESRGFANVIVATNNEARQHVEAKGLEFLGTGPTPDVSYEETIVFNRRASPLKVLMALQSFWGKFNGGIFETLQKEWTQQNKAHAPDFLVCDNLTTACHDLAEYFQLPYATVSCHPIGIMGLASSFDEHMAHYLPMEFTVFSRSIHMGFLERLVTPIGKMLLQLPFRSNTLLLGERNKLRARHEMPPVDKWLATTKTKAVPSGKALTIINHSWALDNPTLLPPYMQMVGPLISSQQELFIEPDLQTWLDSMEEQSSMVIYCSFSTAVRFDPEDAKQVVEVVASLPPTFYVLWSLKNYDVVLQGLPLPHNLRLEEFVAQPKVLAHPAVKAFWSHMGTSSTYEGIMAGVPLLAMPFYADQNANAQHAVDRGVALKVDLTNLQPADAVAKLMQLTSEDTDFAAKAQTMQRILQHDGGAERAVDLLHMAIEIGSEHLVPRLYHTDFSFFQYYGLDVALVWMILFFVGIYLSVGRKKK